MAPVNFLDSKNETTEARSSRFLEQCSRHYCGFKRAQNKRWVRRMQRRFKMARIWKQQQFTTLVSISTASIREQTDTQTDQEVSP